METINICMDNLLLRDENKFVIGKCPNTKEHFAVACLLYPMVKSAKYETFNPCSSNVISMDDEEVKEVINTYKYLIDIKWGNIIATIEEYKKQIHMYH